MTEIVNNENTNKILTYKCKNCNYRMSESDKIGGYCLKCCPTRGRRGVVNCHHMRGRRGVV